LPERGSLAFGLRTGSGRLFQVDRTAMTKAWRLYVLSRWHGMCSRFANRNRSLAGQWGTMINEVPRCMTIQISVDHDHQLSMYRWIFSLLQTWTCPPMKQCFFWYRKKLARHPDTTNIKWDALVTYWNQVCWLANLLT